MRGISILLFLAAGGWQLGAAQQRPLALDDYYRIEVVSSPAISPDGRWVAYLRGYILESENRRRSELWLVSFDGSAAPRRISDSTANAGEPRWSPVPSRFVRYPGMYHGGWSPWNTVHRYHEETKWWDRWLRGATP